MSRIRNSTPKPKPVSKYSPSNPELPLSQVLKMQNLLDEYDRENSFLNSQVMELLARNKQLEANKFSSHKDSAYSKNWRIERDIINEGRQKKAFNYLKELDK